MLSCTTINYNGLMSHYCYFLYDRQMQFKIEKIVRFSCVKTLVKTTVFWTWGLLVGVTPLLPQHRGMEKLHANRQMGHLANSGSEVKARRVENGTLKRIRCR